VNGVLVRQYNQVWNVMQEQKPFTSVYRWVDADLRTTQYVGESQELWERFLTEARQGAGSANNRALYGFQVISNPVSLAEGYQLEERAIEMFRPLYNQEASSGFKLGRLHGEMDYSYRSSSLIFPQFTLRNPYHR
jgi:hypothetical protein